ncbi:MAG: class II fructose-bisphosphate aldolase, partial [Clostridia bacterium]|nr:class II fructose-bisphosphate aldolase [Clostridia bacterium]
MYCNTDEMLQDARKNSYAIGAFNISNMEFAQAIIKASEEMQMPVILQASESACKYAGFDELVAMVKCMAEKSPSKIALHLDHGKSFDVCKKAIDAGFSSVMIDLSGLSFEDNIIGTKEVVDYAKKHNVSVESELGEIIGVEDEQVSNVSHFTDPKKAKEFVERTGVTSLAVSI